MSNPYTQPSIAGYNASPPPDDGTAVASNQLQWSKHITKIGNPLKTYAQAIDAAVLAAFGLEFGAAVLTKTTHYIVTTNDRGRWIGVTGTSTITLPSAATVDDGFPLLVTNLGTAIVTIDADSSELINGALTLKLVPGDFALINSNGTAWTAAGRYTEYGSFVPTFSGFSVDPVDPVVRWVKNGNLVTVQLYIFEGTSNSINFIITNPPAAIEPDWNQLSFPLVAVVDNGGAPSWGLIELNRVSDQWLIYYEAGDFTNSGSKGLGGVVGHVNVFTYPLKLDL